MLLKSDDLKCVLQVASRNEECALSSSASGVVPLSTGGTCYVLSWSVSQPALALFCEMNSDLNS